MDIGISVPFSSLCASENPEQGGSSFLAFSSCRHIFRLLVSDSFFLTSNRAWHPEQCVLCSLQHQQPSNPSCNRLFPPCLGTPASAPLHLSLSPSPCPSLPVPPPLFPRPLSLPLSCGDDWEATPPYVRCPDLGLNRALCRRRAPTRCAHPSSLLAGARPAKDMGTPMYT